MLRARPLLSLLPLCVGAISLGITGWLWQHEQQSTRQVLKADFDHSVRQTVGRIESRLADCEQMLRGVQGLILASDNVKPEQFQTYIDALLANADFAGIQFFAHAHRRPSGPGIEPSAKVIDVAPATAANLEIVGADLLANPVQRATMQRAADSGSFSITPQLFQPTGQARSAQDVFQMFLPVYAKDKAVNGVAARRAALAGWVLAHVRMSELMSSLYGEGTPGIDVRIHDGLELSQQSLMYATNPEAGASTSPRFEALEYIGIAGHTWTLAVSARAEFEQRHGSGAARTIAWLGAGLSLLLALLTRQLVSGRHRANDAALAMTRQLRISEERYRRIVETADEGIWVTDEHSRTVFANPKLARMLGCSSEELQGRLPAEFHAEVASPDQGAASAAKPPDSDGPQQRALRRKDGTLLWVSMATTPIVDAAGRSAGQLSMVTDITAQVQAEARRAELEAQLRESQKMEAIGTLAGGIAHDFNNILAAILGNAALAQERAAHDPTLKSGLDQISVAAMRARSLVQQILAFSHKQPHRLLSQSLRPLIEEAVSLLRPVLPALVELQVALADAPMYVRADATQIQQVVMNLCTNAWHALGGQAGRITIRLERAPLDDHAALRLGLQAGDHARLSVSDTGCGMDEATRARIFEPFFTTKAVGQGTGLGLSVVHGIVATHGGAIAVASALGQGSQFDLYLPLLAQRDTMPAGDLGAAAAPLFTDRHVAYVDDDPSMVLMVRALLRRSGYQVSGFEDPREAIAALRSQPQAFDIVVTDYNMPHLSGLDVAREVAQIRSGLPVVLSSGYITEAIIAEAAQLGVRFVMQKEFTLERLCGILGRLLQESDADAAVHGTGPDAGQAD
ncbi:MAG: CHASE domain-containing protein [Ideonella sp.]|nr:CHASE domain-containing protein [Ideonella sp.]